MSALLPNPTFQPVTSRHPGFALSNSAVGGDPVGDGLSPTEMAEPVTDRNRLGRSLGKVVTDRCQLQMVAVCNHLLSEGRSDIREYPQIAVVYL